MPPQDHRPRVAAERRERMRLRLLATAVSIGAEKGPASVTIDEVTVAAEVSRGSFYKYFPSMESLMREVATEIANDLIRMVEPQMSALADPAERVAYGIRAVSRTAINHPVVAAFIVGLGWSDVRGPGVLLEFARRDLSLGIHRRRFVPMPMELALNTVVGAVMSATHTMLNPSCGPSFAEQTAAAVLRALGISPAEAKRVSTRPLPSVVRPVTGLLAGIAALASKDSTMVRSACRST
jgi:TetR/AcrR family transcriptional regulator, ethionamide resistance regulator